MSIGKFTIVSISCDEKLKKINLFESDPTFGNLLET